ncbi:chloride channel protein [Cavenderia fasciculata]|uniref:Chloride channel protein n=1 Tax=Cavenderia fasciculata TaxID=261658 RepID=F4PN99_CACFS|nr:chloride channel protein [Cavenderia fasciculata]EGG22952.1 chloride channel protein [Cavenderia fasciculata]|eukprot:XP_004360803.1 chloride channel protein [Cavenderia fasciculata]
MYTIYQSHHYHYRRKVYQSNLSSQSSSDSQTFSTSTSTSTSSSSSSIYISSPVPLKIDSTSHNRHIPKYTRIKHGYKKSRLRSAPSDADLFNLVMPKSETVGFKSKQGGISKQAIKWSKFTRLNNFYIWLFLAVVGLMASILLVTIDLIFKYVVFAGRDRFMDLTENYFLQYISFIFWTCLLAVSSSLVIKKICYAAAGSGVPDLKSIFSGFWNPTVVKPSVLVWKTIGLLLSYGSGLSIGKEGPYIHISAILTNTLLYLKPFKNIAINETQRSQMLASCCALGVAATFGSPIGGVLFSIEVTGTYYLISNYWRAFFASTVGAVGIKILLSTPSNDLLESYRTNFESVNLASVQLLALIITGVLCGLLGSLFIYMYTKIYNWKKNNQDLIQKLTPYGEVLVVAAVTAVLSFPLKFLRLDHASAVHTMFTAHDDVNSEELKVWTESMPFDNVGVDGRVDYTTYSVCEMKVFSDQSSSTTILHNINNNNNNHHDIDRDNNNNNMGNINITNSINTILANTPSTTSPDPTPRQQQQQESQNYNDNQDMNQIQSDMNNNNNNNDNGGEGSSMNQQQQQPLPIDLVQMELQNPWVVIDNSPFQIGESMPVRKIVFMFMMLGGNVIYVLQSGKLVGLITKTDLLDKG